MAGVRPLALLAALLLCERADAFGGLNYVRFSALATHQHAQKQFRQHVNPFNASS